MRRRPRRLALESLEPRRYAIDLHALQQPRTRFRRDFAQHARGIVDLEGPERTLRKVFGPMRMTEAIAGDKFAEYVRAVAAAPVAMKSMYSR